MKLVDIHCHLDHARFRDDLDNIIENARKAGVKAIITSGVNTSTNRRILEIQEKHPDIVKLSFGLYPIDALKAEIEGGESDGFVRDIEGTDPDKELEWIEENKDRCVAVGEAGLDYHWLKDRQAEMKAVFQKVISTVERMKKPIVVHTRKAELDCIEMLESSSIKPGMIILHCFSGRKHLVKRATDNGWNFSVPPIIVKLQHFQQLADIAGISQILTETDAPYLSPYSGKRNEPAYVYETIKKIAEIKNLTEEETANSIFMNYQRIFC